MGWEGTLRSISRTTQCYEVVLVEDLVEGMGWESTLRSISGTTQCYEVTLVEDLVGGIRGLVSYA